MIWTSRPACLVYGAILGAACALWLSRPRPVVITTADIAFQHAVPDAGLAEATPVTPEALRAEVADAGMPDLTPWMKANHARPDGLLTGRLDRAQKVPGVSKVLALKNIPNGSGDALKQGIGTGVPPDSAGSKNSSATADCRSNYSDSIPELLSYDWHDLHHRFHLTDDLLHPGRAEFTARQSFKLAVLNIAQDGSPLRQEQVQLTEVDPETGEAIGPAEVRDLHYSYVPATPPPNYLNTLWIGAGGHAGTDGIAPLYAVGYSRRLWRFTLGLQVMVEQPTVARPVMAVDGLASLGWAQ